MLLANGTPRTYRGSIVANWATSTSITPVSVLPMEDYLRAVVPAEMPSSWSPAALAAQAVAARSYASYDRAYATAGRTWDTCDTTWCQMYSGVPAEKGSSDEAIAATAGQMLTYQGQPAFTQFGAANCGWSAAGTKPYLVATADPYDGVIPNSANTWTNTISVASIEAKWPSIGTYRQLRIISRDAHGQWGGRVLQLAIDGSTGSVTFTGAAIRSAFGLRSEWFLPTNPRSAPSYPRDFSGDGLVDVLAVVAKTGDLRMYAGNGASGWKPMSVIGTGFTGFSKVFTAGTWDNDALSDVMAQTPDGNLWLYPGTASGPIGPQRQVGSGWGIYNLVFPVGDFGGDGFSDLLARRPDGGLVLYSGNGSGGWLPRRLIGRGWNMFSTSISSGDFNSDGRADLLGRGWDGTLWMYPGNGTGGFLPRKAVGTGWGIFSTILP
ncbi:MAG: SpoIID/LytB domain-containing protein [Dermatophilaceae bacterium]